MNFGTHVYAPCVRILDVKGTDATAYCIPGAGASVSCFLPFANATACAFNIVGMQPRGLDDAEGPHESVEDAAGCYVDAMLKQQQGPFRLLGHSFGGWVTFEVAARLVRRGFEVMPILLLDSTSPQRQRTAVTTLSKAEVLHRYVRVLEQAAGRVSKLSAAELYNVLLIQGIDELLRRLKSSGLLPQTLAAPMFARLFRTFEVHVNTPYSPAMLPIEVHLIHASDSDDVGEDHVSAEQAAAQWRHVAPNLRSIVVSGNHMTMLDSPHVEAVARVARAVWLGHAHGTRVVRHSR